MLTASFTFLGRLGPRPPHSGHEEGATPASLEAREGGAGSRHRLQPAGTAPPGPRHRAQAQPRQSRRAPRLASQRGTARPRPQIGRGRGRGGPGQRAADSRWRRPGGGFQPSRREGQEHGGEPRLAAWLPGGGRGGRRSLPAGVRPGAAGGEAPPFTFALPASTFLRRCSCSVSISLRGASRVVRKVTGQTRRRRRSIYTPSPSPSPATTVTQTWARPAPGPVPGVRRHPHRQSGARFLPARVCARAGRCGPGGAPPRRLRLAR